jgi:hypothetical protein
MFELIARLLLAIGAAAAAFRFGSASEFEWVGGAAALFAALGVFVFLLERRGLRNPGVAGFSAVADSFLVAFALAAVGRLDAFGYVVLAPLAYAAARFGSHPSAMAPLAAAALLVADAVVARHAQPSLGLLGTVGLVAAIGLLMTQRRTVMSESQAIGEPVLPPADPETPDEAIEPTAYLQLRESYRALRDEFRQLQIRSRQDRLLVRLVETRHAKGADFYKSVASTMVKLTRVDQAILHTYAQFSDAFVVRAVEGEVPFAMSQQALHMDVTKGLESIPTQAADRLRALQTPGDKLTSANVVLLDQGRPCGMLTLRCENPETLDEARQQAEESAPILAWLLRESAAQRRTEARLREAELLYEIATATAGAQTPESLAARVVAELGESFDWDHLGVVFLDGSEMLHVAGRGRTIRFLETMSFAYGPGSAGWLKIGAPELALFDVFEDQRCDRAEALRQRVGSFCAIPIQFDETPYGILTVSTPVAGGLDVHEQHTLRMVATELGQAIGRLVEQSQRESGLMTAKEFQTSVAEAGEGWLVYLEPLKKGDILETFGRPALMRAQRTFARKLRAKLPLGGMLCRRAEGDFVAFLPGASEPFAHSWANEAAAMASMVAIEGAGGMRKPLALRARSAPIRSESAVAA